VGVLIKVYSNEFGKSERTDQQMNV
jgi:hypothetical protein